MGGSGRRDGLAHAIYGGVYGKDHGVLAGHPRTGELMPMLVPMSAAAPCGFERYDSHVVRTRSIATIFFSANSICARFRGTCCGRRAARLSPRTATLSPPIHVDFHPTDVLMDADGSLLVVDTGGWYKLCCPTSQLWKPDVLGGIYRVRRIDAQPVDDPRGREIPWSNLNVEQLWALLSDGRAAVRQRASQSLVGRRNRRPCTSSLHIWRSSACVVFLSASQRQTRTQATRRRLRWHDCGRSAKSIAPSRGNVFGNTSATRLNQFDTLRAECGEFEP